MKARDDLFFLIQSLDASERKRLGSKLKRGGTLESLLQSIEELSDWNESALRKNLAGKPVLNQLPVAKIALQDATLAVLLELRASSFVDKEVADLLEQVKELKERITTLN